MIKMLFQRFYSEYSTLNIPVLDISEQVGDTGYIDFITSEMMSHYIMKGVDRFGRQFLSLKVEIKRKIKDEVNTELKYKTTNAVGTFFFRYSDNNYPIVFGTCYPRDSIYHTTTATSLTETNIAFGRIKKLLAGEMIRSINIYYSDSISSFISAKDDELEELYINGNGNKFIYIPEIRNKIKEELMVYLYNDIAGLVMEYF